MKLSPTLEAGKVFERRARLSAVPAQDAVPQALIYLGCFSSNLPQNRHPERSASQIYRVVQRWARSRRTSKGAYSIDAVGTLSTTEARPWATGHGSTIRHRLADGR
ncbi:MAG: hypothetical protein QOH35_2391 [Acidobacteriaceae bacterium]|jgi:hypothetical protein|nr:hypothetical protein [Acidobacteriaceae bacterium]